MTITTETLIDRAAISDVVIKYGTALDTRNWSLLRSILMDPIQIDYTSFNPDMDKTMPADEWVDSVKHLGNFDATQHISSNHVHIIDGDEATCVSYMQAGHFLKVDGEERVRFLYGYYTNNLIRHEGSWKIRKCTLTITACHGDASVFAIAFGQAY